MCREASKAITLCQWSRHESEHERKKRRLTLPQFLQIEAWNEFIDDTRDLFLFHLFYTLFNTNSKYV